MFLNFTGFHHGAGRRLVLLPVGMSGFATGYALDLGLGFRVTGFDVRGIGCH